MTLTLNNETPLSTPAPLVAQARLGYLPVGLFGSVMGLTGLSAAWRLAHGLFGTPLWIAHLVGALALLAFIAIAVGYAIKASSNFAAVRAEFNHPIAGNMFGTPLISILLLPILLADFNLTLARWIWGAGVIGMSVFAWLIVSRLISVRQLPGHATPAWIVPVVGLIDIPLAVPALHLQDVHGLMMFALAVGLFFAIPLLTLIVSRLMFGEPLPPAMRPALLVLVAPFAVGFSAYVTTLGQVDSFAQGLFLIGLFILAVVLGQLRHWQQNGPFKLSWWAASFPLSASATAALRYADFAQDNVASSIAVVVLALASVAIGALLVRTLVGVARGELRALSS